MAFLVQLANGVPGVKFPLDKREVRIGRGLDNDICLPDAYVSKAHALIEAKPGEQLDGSVHYFLRDLKSTNCTYLNNEKVSRSRLHAEDIVKIGQSFFKFVDEEGAYRDLTADSVVRAFGSHDASQTRSFSRRLRSHHH